MKSSFLLLAAVAAVMTMVACGSKEKEDQSKDQTRNIEFESYTYDIIGEYTGSDSIPTQGGRLTRFIGHGVLPKDINNTDIKKLRETLMNISGISLKDGEISPVMPDSTLMTELPTDTDACGEIISNLSTTLVTPRAIVWENETYAYACLAAHGNHATRFVNFCLSDGKIISLSDLFKPDYKNILESLIREQLKNGGYDLLLPLDQIGIAPQFGLTAKGIIFSYDPYQIAPYSEGTIQVEIPTAELLDILNDHGTYILLGISSEE